PLPPLRRRHPSGAGRGAVLLIMRLRLSVALCLAASLSCSPPARQGAPAAPPPEVKPILMLSGALVADGFDGPALDTQAWHRPDWVVKNDPNLTVGIRDGHL